MMASQVLGVKLQTVPEYMENSQLCSDVLVNRLLLTLYSKDRHPAENQLTDKVKALQGCCS